MTETRPTRLPLLILGASARAASASADRAGFLPIAVDLFADRDLASRFPAHRIERRDYPLGLDRIARVLPNGPWIYTGSLENHPGLISRIAARRRLLGIGGPALEAVRDPPRWSAALREAGLPSPICLVAGDPPPSSGEWLAKPLASATGLRIRPWVSGTGPLPRGDYLQERFRGIALAAIYLGDGRTSRLVGVTRQLLGRSAGGLRVAYRGSVGPWPLPEEAGRILARIGQRIAKCFGLMGLFGIDLVLVRGIPVPVEINPRYTASVEVLERATGRALLADHARACGFAGTFQAEHVPGRVGLQAKRILFARRPARAPAEWPWANEDEDRPMAADFPSPGIILMPGEPVMTVFGEGRSVSTAMASLRASATLWRRRIGSWETPEAVG